MIFNKVLVLGTLRISIELLWCRCTSYQNWFIFHNRF